MTQHGNQHYFGYIIVFRNIPAAQGNNQQSLRKYISEAGFKINLTTWKFRQAEFF